jgi:hypothetical protein
MGKAAALSVVRLTYSPTIAFQPAAKLIKIEQSQPKPEPNLSKKNTLIGFDWLRRNGLFQWDIADPWVKKVCVG